MNYGRPRLSLKADLEQAGFYSLPTAVKNQLASASRLSLAQALFCGTAFIGGPPPVPQEHGPSVLASVMQKQDLFFRHEHT